MMYGNSLNGYSFSPSANEIDYMRLHSQFLGANGNRQVGYYGSNTSGSEKTSGHYDGRGVWVE